MWDFDSVEKKWQKEWKQAKLFESDPQKKKKFFTSNIIPYVNGDVHLGHAYTYTRTDAYARFKRMRGFNVLLAQGFHATGEPIVGAVERLKKEDKAQINTFKMFGATDAYLKKFVANGPTYVAKFWTEKMKESLKSVGYSIDWRRSFTLSVDPQFSAFVRWQYKTLKKKKLVVKGTHPVVWCPSCQSPTGDHDRLEGEGESPVEYALIKFDFKEYKLPCATLRPETVYGVTNIWIHPGATYTRLLVGDENWIVSKDAAHKIKDQFSGVEELGDIKNEEFFSKRAVDPLSRKAIPILPADFVDPTSATGVVLGVPAHAPYDWIAVKQMIKDGLEKYGVLASELQPVSLIEVPGFGEYPAVEICEERGIKSLDQRAELEKATNDLYKKEFHQGVLKKMYGDYAGKKVAESRESMVSDFVDRGVASRMWDVSGVACRCGTPNHVKVLKNQWFLKYSDKKWKNRVKKHLEKMDIYPEEARNNFFATLEWLKDKACARKTGLGTPIPWDPEWIVETLSDSTIYMAYYTIAKTINQNSVEAGQLPDEVFDYLFLGKGKLSSVSKKTSISKRLLKQMKREFNYFYPMDFRNSGKDLIQNHLAFYLFHHAAIWPKDKWPAAISANGHVSVEGEKMSKSRGNFVTLRELVDTYGADMTRINVACAGEGLDDADWRVENLKSFRSRYEFLYKTVNDIKKAKKRRKRNVEKHFLSRIQDIVRDATENYEELKLRSAANSALFGGVSELKWYLSRAGGIENANRRILRNGLSKLIRLLAPMTPHICEELWAMLGKKKFVSARKWPKYEKRYVDKKAERAEDFLKSVIGDVKEIKSLVEKKGMRPEKAVIFVAEKWKFDVYKFVRKNSDKDFGDVMKSAMKIEPGSGTERLVKSLYKDADSLGKPVLRTHQLRVLKQAKNFLSDQTGLGIEIKDSAKSDHEKSDTSSPRKPGILLE